jgi:hypothetical protein
MVPGRESNQESKSLDQAPWSVSGRMPDCEGQMDRMVIEGGRSSDVTQKDECVTDSFVSADGPALPDSGKSSGCLSLACTGHQPGRGLRAFGDDMRHPDRVSQTGFLQRFESGDPL